MTIDQILVTQMAVFSYLLTDEFSGEALIIDPAGDFPKINLRIKERNANVKHIINTHGHPDHTSGNLRTIKETGADVMIHRLDLYMLTGGYSAVLLEDGDTISFGRSKLKVIHTPGHTKGGICLYGYGCVFTGDTIFTEGIGRTDIKDASLEVLMSSIKNKIFTLPSDTRIYPGHDYGVKPFSTVAEQKRMYGM